MQNGYYPCAIFQSGWVLDCDCYFDSLQLYGQTEIFHVEIGTECIAYGNGNCFINRVLWGAGYVSPYEGGCISNESGGTWASAMPIATILFEYNVGSTGSSYDDTTGLWTGQILPTIANLDGYTSLINPLSGSRFYYRYSS